MARQSLNTRGLRPIVLETPKSGMDMLFEEISKYASPEYQLKKQQLETEQSRYNARLELERQDRIKEQSRYDDLKAARDRDYDLRKDNYDLNIRNERKKTLGNNFLTFKQELGTSIEGLPLSSIANLEFPTSAYLTDPVNLNKGEKYLETIKNKAQSRLELGKERVESFNTAFKKNLNPDTNADLFMSSDYTDFISSEIFKDAGEVDQKTSMMIKNQMKLIPLYDGQIESYIAALNLNTEGYTNQGLEELTGKRKDLMDNIERFINPQETVEFEDPFTDYQGALDRAQYITERGLSLPVSLGGETNDYDLVFSDDSDDEIILATALDLARNNATGSDVNSVSVDRPEDAPEDIPNWMFEPITEGGQPTDKKKNRLIEGLSTSIAGSPAANKEEDDTELFTEDIPSDERSKIPSKLKDARYGAKDIQKKIKQIKKDEVQSKTSPNAQTRKNISEGLETKKKELKIMFNSIYNSNNNSFFDDESERIKKLRADKPFLRGRPLKYREFLTTEEINLLKSL